MTSLFLLLCWVTQERSWSPGFSSSHWKTESQLLSTLQLDSSPKDSTTAKAKMMAKSIFLAQSNLSKKSVLNPRLWLWMVIGAIAEYQHLQLERPSLLSQSDRKVPNRRRTQAEGGRQVGPVQENSGRWRKSTQAAQQAGGGGSEEQAGRYCRATGSCSAWKPTGAISWHKYDALFLY